MDTEKVITLELPKPKARKHSGNLTQVHRDRTKYHRPTKKKEKDEI